MKMLAAIGIALSFVVTPLMAYAKDVEMRYSGIIENRDAVELVEDDIFSLFIRGEITAVP